MKSIPASYQMSGRTEGQVFLLNIISWKWMSLNITGVGLFGEMRRTQATSG